MSEGIGRDLTGLFGAMAPPGDIPQAGVAYAMKNDIAATMQTAPTGYHDVALIDMMEAMRRSNVATDAIDPRGRVESKDLARECFPAPEPGIDPCSEGPGLLDWVSPVRQAQHGLEIMSEASGGFAVTNTDDFTSGLKRIVEDLDHYYLLDGRDHILFSSHDPANDRGHVDARGPLAGLSSGAYRLRVTVSDGTASATRRRGLVIALPAPGNR